MKANGPAARASAGRRVDARLGRRCLAVLFRGGSPGGIAQDEPAEEQPAPLAEAARPA
jgi:hypothetical protein